MSTLTKKGFSLVELSIVLIIIGLLFVGVSSGAKLIQAAKINKIMTQISTVDSGFLAFFQAYDALPGDFNDATSFWGTTEIADGDGDGSIEINPTAPVSDAKGDEVSNSLLHMQRGEFIEGNYTAQIDQAEYAYKTELSAHLIISSQKNSNDNDLTGFPSISNKNTIILAKNVSSSRSATDPGVNSAFLTPRQAYTIDKKYDDSLPKTGRITYRDESSATGNVTESSCTDGSDAYLSSGNNAEAQGCNLIYTINN